MNQISQMLLITLFLLLVFLKKRQIIYLGEGDEEVVTDYGWHWYDGFFRLKY